MLQRRKSLPTASGVFIDHRGDASREVHGGKSRNQSYSPHTRTTFEVLQDNGGGQVDYTRPSVYYTHHPSVATVLTSAQGKSNQTDRRGVNHTSSHSGVHRGERCDISIGIFFGAHQNDAISILEMHGQCQRLQVPATTVPRNALVLALAVARTMAPHLQQNKRFFTREHMINHLFQDKLEEYLHSDVPKVVHRFMDPYETSLIDSAEECSISQVNTRDFGRTSQLPGTP